MSGHLDGPPPGPPDPPYIPGDLGAPSAEEFARRRAGDRHMSEFRVVEANGDPYPPHAQPCRTLEAAELRRDFYESVQSVSGEARMPVKPLRIERRSMVVSMWEPWNVGAARDTNEPASPADERLREALAEIVALPVVDDSDADRMREIAEVALAGVSAVAAPDDAPDETDADDAADAPSVADQYPISDSEFIEPPFGVDTPPPNPSPDGTTRYARRGFGIASGAPPVMSNMRAPEPGGDNPAITPPSNPYPFHEPLRVEHHSDEDKRQAWDEGYAAGVVAGRSIPSTGTGWDRGYAAGLAARDTSEPKEKL